MGADELRGRGRPGKGFRGDWRSWPRGACSIFILWAFSWDHGGPQRSLSRGLICGDFPCVRAPSGRWVSHRPREAEAGAVWAAAARGQVAGDAVDGMETVSARTTRSVQTAGRLEGGHGRSEENNDQKRLPDSQSEQLRRGADRDRGGGWRGAGVGQPRRLQSGHAQSEGAIRHRRRSQAGQPRLEKKRVLRRQDGIS